MVSINKKSKDNKGKKGDPGAPGIGIDSWEKKGDGLVITLTNKRTIEIEDVRGPKGEQGDVGPKGDKGDQGPEGPKGPKGLKGDKGPRGKDGKDGKDGEKGEPGDKGLKGDTGSTGLQGDKGEKGDKGDKGDVGPQGPQGEVGEKGDPGKDGLDAPCSRFVSVKEIDDFTNAETPSKSVFKHDIVDGGTVGVSVLLGAKGSNQVSYFYGSKHCLLYKIHDQDQRVIKIENDIPNHICRKSDHKFSFEIVQTKDGFEIFAKGSTIEEMIWRGEVRILTI